MKIDIFGDGISYVTDEVSTVKTIEANLNEENRIKFVTDLAAVSRGKNESVNPKKRYEALKTEAALGTASRPLEFLPVVIDYDIIYDNNEGYDKVKLTLKYEDEPIEMSLEDFFNKIGRFSYLDRGVAYTNMRALLNAGIPYEAIPYSDKQDPDDEEWDDVFYKHFKAIKLCIPMFVWAQWPMTHTMLSKESQSDRVATQDQYWLPEDFEKRLLDFIAKGNLGVIAGDGNMSHIFEHLADYVNSPSYENDIVPAFKERMILYDSQDIVQVVFKALGYKQEIWSRAPYYFKYKEVIVTGWDIDSATWKHSFLERNVMQDKWKNWTQKETTKVLEAVKQIIRR
jgi:Fe-S cluster biosynthesis and repair protein YggX/cell fate (sporulation/competence/biofilm development) regulator YmcA (YheA/YmcA/DUF963 family)